MLLPTLLVAAAWGCESELPDSALIATDAAIDAQTVIDSNQNPYAFNDQNGTRWMVDNCASCHGEDATGTRGAAYSSWGMSAEFSAYNVKAALAELQLSSATPYVYQTIYNVLTKAGVPSPMPPSSDPTNPFPNVTDERRAEIIKALGWLYGVAPIAVAEAEARFGTRRLRDLPDVTFHFSCSTPATRRKFLANFTYAALDRPPTQEEIVALGNPEQAIARDERLALVARLRGEWKESFLASGLRKLARFVGGAGGIDVPANNDGNDGKGLSPAALNDLKDELYASYRRHYDDTSYDDFFRSSTVAVTANTAPSYGCTFRARTAVMGWDECIMQAPRKGFFTTLGFLSSKPSSFLEGNNNYGRVASMYFSIFGETLRPDTAGPAGGAPKPLPACLESNDTRHANGGPIGSAAVPNFGAICQTCHVARAMAAGSVLFRRFSLHGLQYTPEMLSTAGMPPAFDAASLETATTAETWHLQPDDGANRAPRLSREQATTHLVGLLNASINNPQACIPTGRSDAPYVIANDVASFAEYYLRLSDPGVARAFGRHANRAFANSSEVSFELAHALSDAFANGRRKLPDLVETYFASETFACSETP